MVQYEYHHTISLRNYHMALIANVTKTHVVDAIPSAATFVPRILPTLQSSPGAGVGL